MGAPRWAVLPAREAAGPEAPATWGPGRTFVLKAAGVSASAGEASHGVSLGPGRELRPHDGSGPWSSASLASGGQPRGAMPLRGFSEGRGAVSLIHTCGPSASVGSSCDASMGQAGPGRCVRASPRRARVRDRESVPLARISRSNLGNAVVLREPPGLTYPPEPPSPGVGQHGDQRRAPPRADWGGGQSPQGDLGGGGTGAEGRASQAPGAQAGAGDGAPRGSSRPLHSLLRALGGDRRRGQPWALGRSGLPRGRM